MLTPEMRVAPADWPVSPGSRPALVTKGTTSPLGAAYIVLAPSRTYLLRSGSMLAPGARDGLGGVGWVRWSEVPGSGAAGGRGVARWRGVAGRRGAPIAGDADRVAQQADSADLGLH